MVPSYYNFKTGEYESFDVVIPGPIDGRGTPPQNRLHEFISQDRAVQVAYFRQLREGKTPLYAFEQCLKMSILSGLAS